MKAKLGVSALVLLSALAAGMVVLTVTGPQLADLWHESGESFGTKSAKTSDGCPPRSATSSASVRPSHDSSSARCTSTKRTVSSRRSISPRAANST